ncbi:MAG: hypothetical protein ACKPH7_04795 [Planktothrix sp.]|uniref:hypothetical protein n=1 Tax=Planktothrix sp. TaxID=3088171 RepID=UPI0038D47B5E
MDELNKQLTALGISPEELSKQLASMGISLDEVAKKFASLTIPGIIVAATFTTFGGAGLVVALATALAGPVAVIGDSLTGYGIEMVLGVVYIERAKNEPLDNLLKEIDILPLTDPLKLKLKNQLTQAKPIENTVIDIPQVVTVVEEA